jgi:hypothetical protein
MGLSENQYADRLRQALRHEGEGLVEPQEKTGATAMALGRRVGFLEEDQPVLRAANRGAAIGGAAGALAGTAWQLSRKHPYSAQTAGTVSLGRRIAAPVGALVGATIGHELQRRSNKNKKPSTDAKVIRQAVQTSTLLGGGYALKQLGTSQLGRLGAATTLSAAAGASGAAAMLNAARFVGRHKAGMQKDKRPSLGTAGEVLSGAALGATIGKGLGQRRAVATFPGSPGARTYVKSLFSRKAARGAGQLKSRVVSAIRNTKGNRTSLPKALKWAVSGARRAKGAAKLDVGTKRAVIKNLNAHHFRRLEARGAGIGTVVGAGLALGLLAAESRRRKNRKDQQ